jgi:hypothetical protein
MPKTKEQYLAEVKKTLSEAHAELSDSDLESLLDDVGTEVEKLQGVFNPEDIEDDEEVEEEETEE